MRTKFFSIFTIILAILAIISIASMAYIATNDNLKNTIEYIDTTYLNSRLKPYYDNAQAVMPDSKNAQINSILNGNPNTETNEPLKYFKITEVPMINQFPELPTGCEITSATMALRYLGIVVSKEELANKIAKHPLPYKGIGGDPNQAFVGSPYDENSYGVFHAPLFNLMRNYTDRVQDITGTSFEDLLSQIAAGKPAIVWTTTDLKEFVYEDSWTINGIPFTWPGNEHASVLIGYSSTQVIVNDPLTGTEKTFDKAAFKAKFDAMGNQAIIVTK